MKAVLSCCRIFVCVKAITNAYMLENHTDGFQEFLKLFVLIIITVPNTFLAFHSA